MRGGKNKYNTLPDPEKQHFARECIKNWHGKDGRFLQQDNSIGLWHEAEDSAVCRAVQTYMSRKRPLASDASPITEGILAVDGDRVIEGHSGAPCLNEIGEVLGILAKAASPAFTSCRFSGGILSFRTAPSSDWSESCRETAENACPAPSSPPTLPPNQKDKGRMSALARWTTRLLEPVRRLFRRGRCHRRPLAP